MKKRRRPSAGRFIIIVLLVMLTLYGFFIGPLRALTNDIVLGGLLNLSVAFAIMAVFFYLTLWLAGSHVLPVNPRDRHEKRGRARPAAPLCHGRPCGHGRGA